MAVLYTNGLVVTRTTTGFESFTSIRYSTTDAVTHVRLTVSNAGVLDLSDELGSQSAIVFMESGTNSLTSGSGNDMLFLGAGHDSAFGGDGGDYIVTGAGDDLVYGGTGGDNIAAGLAPPFFGAVIDSSGLGGRDTVFGGDGNDNINVVASQYGLLTLFGGVGDDNLNFYAETGTVQGLLLDPGQSVERVSGVVQGTDAAGVFDFGAAILDDNLSCSAGGGNDVIRAVSGGGFLYGGDGNDTIYGGDAGAWLFGGAGRDQLFGSTGNDTFELGLDGDSLSDQGGIDKVQIHSGNVSFLDLDPILLWAEQIEIWLENLAVDFRGTNGADFINFAGVTATFYSATGLSLDSGSGNDTLVGTSGTDVIVGGTGADSMAGRGGNDSYVVDDIGDTVTELAGEGNDFIECSLSSFTLPQDVESLTMTGIADVMAFGSEADDGIWAELGNTVTLVGNGGNDVLRGGGQCLLYGGVGNDDLAAMGKQGVLNGEGGNDTLQGSFGNDQLLGGVGDDRLIGGDGNDRLLGGSGSDTFAGGDGDDTYVAQKGDLIMMDSGGHDTVVANFDIWTMQAGIDDFVSTSSKGVHIIGNLLANSIKGTAFSDSLEGATDDTLAGGRGDDHYTYSADVDTATVLETAAGGNDTVELTTTLRLFTTGSFFMPLNVENLIYRGDWGKRIETFGNDLDNTITVDFGYDTLDGGAGNDSMDAGQGDDVYIVDTLGDSIQDSGASAGDVIRVLVNQWTLDKTTEYLVAGLSADSTLTGNGSDNAIVGNLGDDTLGGGFGDDTLDGWVGRDHLSGGFGADGFVFGFAPLARSVDRIADFGFGRDFILLKATEEGAFAGLAVGQLDRSAFKLRGTSPIDDTDRIIYSASTGVVMYDPDGNGAASGRVIAILENLPSLAASDFWVI